MVITFIKCEMCEAQIRALSHFPGDSLPDEWFVVTEGNPRVHSGLHFCSRQCLSIWGMAHEGERAPLLPAGDFEDLSRAQKDDVRNLHESMVQFFSMLATNFSLRYPEVSVDWRFQLEPRVRREQLV